LGITQIEVEGEITSPVENHLSMKVETLAGCKSGCKIGLSASDE
jgi:hypothetical protein